MKSKISIVRSLLVVMSIMLVCLLDRSAMFQPRVCETEELLDIGNQHLNFLNFANLKIVSFPEAVNGIREC